MRNMGDMEISQHQAMMMSGDQEYTNVTCMCDKCGENRYIHAYFGDCDDGGPCFSHILRRAPWGYVRRERRECKPRGWPELLGFSHRERQ